MTNDPISRLRELEQASADEPWELLINSPDWELACALRNSAKEIIELIEALRDTDNLANLTSREVASAYDSLIAKLSQT